MTDMLAYRDDAGNQVLVLRWGAEQLEGARQALNAARAALKKLKAIEKKRKQKVAHMLHAPLMLLHTHLTCPRSVGVPKTLLYNIVQPQRNLQAACTSTACHVCMSEKGKLINTDD